MKKRVNTSPLSQHLKITGHNNVLEQKKETAITTNTSREENLGSHRNTEIQKKPYCLHNREYNTNKHHVEDASGTPFLYTHTTSALHKDICCEPITGNDAYSEPIREHQYTLGKYINSTHQL